MTMADVDDALLWARNMRVLQHRHDTVLVDALKSGKADYRCDELAEAYRAGKAAGHAARDAEVGALLTALHDAINSPKGVVPASAEPFYNQMRAIEAGDYKEAGDVADD
jgi:hypothetical protein